MNAELLKMQLGEIIIKKIGKKIFEITRIHGGFTFELIDARGEHPLFYVPLSEVKND